MAYIYIYIPAKIVSEITEQVYGVYSLSLPYMGKRCGFPEVDGCNVIREFGSRIG